MRGKRAKAIRRALLDVGEAVGVKVMDKGVYRRLKRGRSVRRSVVDHGGFGALAAMKDPMRKAGM